MTINSQHELKVTREKLQTLQVRYEASTRDESTDPHVRELSLRTLKRLMNQLQEEIVRYECRLMR